MIFREISQPNSISSSTKGSAHYSPSQWDQRDCLYRTCCISLQQVCQFKEYRKVPKFSDARKLYARKLCCNLLKIQTKRPKLEVFYQNDANGIANSEDPDQTAPLGAA